MFESLSEKLSGILDQLTGRGALSEEDVNAAMREVRRALLEADVALEVVRSFIDRARTKAVGAAVVKSVTPGQMVVKIVHDALIETLGGEGAGDRPQRAGAGRDHAGRPAGRRQDDDRRQDRQAPRRAQQGQGADGLARRQAARRRRSSSPCSAARSASTRCRSSPARTRSRSPGAPRASRACRATTSCCSTPPAAPISTSR